MINKVSATWHLSHSNQQTRGMKPEKITIKNYDKLLKEVRDYVVQTRDSIARIATRKKVEMAWKIGRGLAKHLQENQETEKTAYSKLLFERISSDVGIDLTALYRMRSFYKTYPKLPQDDPKLNWSHYKILAGVKNDESRKYLEDLIQEKDLSVVELRKTIKKKSNNQQPKTNNQKLAPRRGELLTYKLFKPVGSTENYIDCGFKIYRALTKKLPKSVKIIEDAKSTEVYTYKGYLNRVVDGDTLRVTLDLGFDIMHEEILRLRGINAIEAAEKGGEEATNGLEKILQNQPFFIVKTSSTDTYNRYLADIFLNDGTYLNQLLLDKKLAVLF